MSVNTVVHIAPEFFTGREKTLVESGPLSASTFRFDSGVCGLRLKNESGSLVCCLSRGNRSGRPSSAGGT
jgi:hypothetical protein